MPVISTSIPNNFVRALQLFEVNTDSELVFRLLGYSTYTVLRVFTNALKTLHANFTFIITELWEWVLFSTMCKISAFGSFSPHATLSQLPQRPNPNSFLGKDISWSNVSLFFVCHVCNVSEHRQKYFSYLVSTPLQILFLINSIALIKSDGRGFNLMKADQLWKIEIMWRYQDLHNPQTYNNIFTSLEVQSILSHVNLCYEYCVPVRSRCHGNLEQLIKYHQRSRRVHKQGAIYRVEILSTP